MPGSILNAKGIVVERVNRRLYSLVEDCYEINQKLSMGSSCCEEGAALEGGAAEFSSGRDLLRTHRRGVTQIRKSLNKIGL